jgi:hypothetical protein
MEVTGNDAGTVMKYSGHKTLESFSIYLKPTDNGRILATQAMGSIGLFFASFPEQEGNAGELSEVVKPLAVKEVAS